MKKGGVGPAAFRLAGRGFLGAGGHVTGALSACLADFGVEHGSSEANSASEAAVVPSGPIG